VEKIAKKFLSFAESEAAENEFYQTLTPEERMEIFFEINVQARRDEAGQRLERGCRVASRDRR